MHTTFQKLLCLLLLLCLKQPIIGRHIETSKPIRPKLVLVQHNPWINSINSDEPDLIIYNNGSVICKEITEKYNCLFHTYLIRRGQIDTLENYINSNADSFLSLPPTVDAYKAFSYHVPEQPDNDLYIHVHRKLIKINIYGELSASTVMAKIPDFLARFLKMLLVLKNNNTPRYTDYQIEVMLWPSPYNQNSTPWPSGWSQQLVPNHQLHTSYVYTLTLDKSKEDSLKNLLSNLKDKESLLIGKQHFAALYRYTWQGEQFWKYFEVPKQK